MSHSPWETHRYSFKHDKWFKRLTAQDIAQECFKLLKERLEAR